MAPVEEPCRAARSRALGFLDDSALPGGGIGPQVVRGDGAVTWNVAAPDADEAPVPAVLGHVLKRGSPVKAGEGRSRGEPRRLTPPPGEGRSLGAAGAPSPWRKDGAVRLRFVEKTSKILTDQSASVRSFKVIPAADGRSGQIWQTPRNWSCMIP